MFYADYYILNTRQRCQNTYPDHPHPIQNQIFLAFFAGELLEEWTHKKSVEDLARRMYLNVDKAWVKTEEAGEVLVSVSEIQPGDHIVVRTGNIIPLDGHVLAGEGADYREILAHYYPGTERVTT